MTKKIRRTIEEIIARYELEPELVDIYVEGEFDADLISSSLESKESRCFIYTIDTVEVPASLLEEHRYTSGNKQRVIALAKELEKKIIGSYGYLCLTDRDLDHWFPPLEEIRNHRWTKYASLEMHFFQSDYLNRHLCRVCRAKIGNFNEFFKVFTDILKSIFAFRCVDKEMNLCLNWIELDRFLTKKNETVNFNFEEFILRTLNKSGKSAYREEVKSRISVWLTLLNGDPRQLIRGHDFVQLLAWVVKNFGGLKDFTTETANYRLFVGAAFESIDISSEIAA